jgi:type IV secretory pathway TraG/TraD family ATPase VirD4
VSPRKEVAQNLVGNCAVKIFLRNTDKETNEFASDLFGKHLVAHGQSGQGGGLRVAMMGQTGNTSDQYDQLVRPERFAELAIPSKAHGVDYCETITHLAARAKMARHHRRQKWKVHPIGN